MHRKTQSVGNASITREINVLHFSAGQGQATQHSMPEDDPWNSYWKAVLVLTIADLLNAAVISHRHQASHGMQSLTAAAISLADLIHSPW